MSTAWQLAKKRPGEQRIGVFGGAFDPPHQAHVALAQAALTQLDLDVLHVVPTGQAWHKARPLSAAAHRLNMARLAFEGQPKLFVDDREVQRAGPTFTIDTLTALQAENAGAQLYLIMGADQFAAFRQWHRWQAILKIAIICIAERSTSESANSQFDAFNEPENRFWVLPMPLMPVSATQIRQKVASSGAGLLALDTLVPAPVARYISQYGLYRPSQSSLPQ